MSSRAWMLFSRSAIISGVTLFTGVLGHGAGFSADGVKHWSNQIQRSPHLVFSGTEYHKAQWPIIMAQMASIGQIPYSEAGRIADYLSAVAPEPSELSSPFQWFDRHFVLSGFGQFAFQNGGQPEVAVNRTSLTYSQIIVGLFDDQWLFQAEPELSRKATSSSMAMTELELGYAHLTYIVNDNFQLTGGKLLSDFNFSNVRLHPSWINQSQDLPWAAGFLPSQTVGWKLAWSGSLSVSTRIGGSLIGGSSPKLVGTRIGMQLLESALEFGTSYGAASPENDGLEHILGGYLIKRWGPLKVQTEIARNISNRAVAYWAEAAYALSGVSEALADFTPVVRWQQYRAPDNTTAEAEAGHATLPENSAKEFYAGLNYTFLQKKGYIARVQAGYAPAIAGGPSDKAAVNLNFRW